MKSLIVLIYSIIIIEKIKKKGKTKRVINRDR